MFSDSADKIIGFFQKNRQFTYSITLLGALYGLKKGIESIQNHSQRKIYAKMEQIASEHKLQRDVYVKNLQIPSPQQIEVNSDLLEKILNSSALELATMIRQGEISSEKLTIGQEYSAITEMNYEQAIEMARSCDELLNKIRTNEKIKSSSTVSSSSSLTQSEGEEFEQVSNIENSLDELFKNKPLFGVPVSIKDIIEMKGFAVTIGCVNRKDKIVQEDSLIIRLIKNSGAIPFVRSNIPQLNMATDCFNRLFGRTCNAWDKSRYSGGSSGGEATLLATRCSPLGFGTDIGGSIRIPASLNGVVGFKPTSGRTPFKGLGFVSNCIAGQLAIRTSLGPMSRYVDDVAIAMKVITDSDFINNQKASQRGAYQPMYQTFDLKKYNDRNTKYRIGYIKSYSLYEACESYQRGVDIAVEALRSQGHELIPIEFPFIHELSELYFNILSSDNNRKYYDQLGEEDFIKEYTSIKFIMKLSPLARRFILWLLRKTKQDRMADIIDWCPVNRPAEDYLAISGRLASKREEVIRYFEQLQIDALITPGQGNPAFKHGNSSAFMIGSLYTHIWNTLNFTAGVLPVTKILPEEQKYESKTINDKITQQLKTHMADNTAGLPVNAQVITLPYEEELCLNLMKQIEEKVNFYKNNKAPI